MGEQISLLLTDWESDLRASRKSPHTVVAYLSTARSYAACCGEDADAITRRSVRRWLTSMADNGMAAATQQTRYTMLDIFCKWLVREEILTSNPMQGMTRPAASPIPVEPYSPGEIAALLTTCGGWKFVQTRDAAMIRMLTVTGMRRSELAGIRLDRIDFEQRVIAILGKGRGGGKWRVVPYDQEAATALRRYMRMRRGHKAAESEMLWLGERGALTSHAIDQMLKRRAKQAGVADVHSHRFRNTFATNWLADGGGELALQTLAGWTSGTMIKRYTAARAEATALAEYRRRRG